MAVNVPPAPTAPDLNSPDTYNARVLAGFQWCFSTMPNYFEGLDAADFFSLLGPVSQSGGTPTGAIIERGSNPQGEYVRFADGTQICTATYTYDATQPTGYYDYVYPAAFVDRPSTGISFSPTNPGANKSAIADMYVASKTIAWSVHHFEAPGSTGFEIYLSAIGRWF